MTSFPADSLNCNYRATTDRLEINFFFQFRLSTQNVQLVGRFFWSKMSVPLHNCRLCWAMIDGVSFLMIFCPLKCEWERFYDCWQRSRIWLNTFISAISWRSSSSSSVDSSQPCTNIYALLFQRASSSCANAVVHTQLDSSLLFSVCELSLFLFLCLLSNSLLRFGSRGCLLLARIDWPWPAPRTATHNKITQTSTMMIFESEIYFTFD